MGGVCREAGDAEGAESFVRNPRYREFVSGETEHNADLQWARHLLIDAVKEVCPAFLRKLSRQVFPLYARMAKNERGEIKKAEDEVDLREEISKWAASFNADRDWIKQGARDTLELWETGSPKYRRTRRRTRRWSPRGVVFPGPAVEEFTFRYQPWRPGLSSWTEYRDSLQREFEKVSSEYKAKVRKSAESSGMRPARRTYSARDIRWLALHEFSGLSCSEIARREFAGALGSTQRVRKGVKAAADLIDWGRPRPETTPA